MQRAHPFYAHTFHGMNLPDKEMLIWHLNSFTIQLKQDFLPQTIINMNSKQSKDFQGSA